VPPLWSATWVARVPVSAAPEREICGALATSQLALKQPNSGRGDSGRFGPSARAVRRLATAASYRSEVTGVAVLMIARFSGDVAELIRAYDRAHAMIMAAGGAEQFGELRHHCATSQDALYIIGVWQSEEHVRTHAGRALSSKSAWSPSDSRRPRPQTSPSWTFVPSNCLCDPLAAYARARNCRVEVRRALALRSAQRKSWHPSLRSAAAV
jgi:hypothetical protein